MGKAIIFKITYLCSTPITVYYIIEHVTSRQNYLKPCFVLLHKKNTRSLVSYLRLGMSSGGFGNFFEILGV